MKACERAFSSPLHPFSEAFFDVDAFLPLCRFAEKRKPVYKGR
jgi:hypothetical protein